MIIINRILFKKINSLFILILICCSIFSGCKSAKKIEPTSADEAFAEALRLFNKKKYQDALSYFDMIKLQYPTSGFTDQAQYYTAEINFIRKEYILASFNYNRVRIANPGSQYAQISLYKAGLSQFFLSPDFHKDQDYTIKAIKTLQDYQFYYPEKDSLYKEADKMIAICRNKLAEKDYRIAELYKVLLSPRSALIYYESVIKDFDDTDFFEPAFFGKIETLHKLKRTEEAQNTERTYNNLFPNGSFNKQIEALNLIKN